MSSKTSIVASLPLHTSHSGAGPVNALSFSPDKNFVIVGGRDVLKVVQVTRNSLQEVRNLKQGKKKGLNFSSNDVKWHPQHAYKDTFASGATNGAVIIWSLERQRSLQERVMKVHQRSVNRISWNLDSAFTLISGSQDSTVKLWDTRSGCEMDFTPNSQSVRDVEFNQYNRFQFAAAFENGSVQVWDIRKQSAPVHRIIAHSGLVLTAQWHPHLPTVLASGGRDRMVKVWDVEHGETTPQRVLQTIEIVGRVSWRPGHPDQLASAAALLDNRVHIWDARRPYLPIAICYGHTNAATGLAWMDSDFGPAQRFLACSKDSTLAMHDVAQAYKPTEHIRASTVAISPFSIASVNDHVDRAAPWELQVGPDAALPSPAGVVHVDNPGRAPAATSRWGVPENALGFDPVSFQYFAENYIMRGRPIQEMCDHNAQVARDMRHHELAQTWTIVGMLYSGAEQHDPAAVAAAATPAGGTGVATQGPPTTGAAGGAGGGAGAGAGASSGRLTVRQQPRRASAAARRVSMAADAGEDGVAGASGATGGLQGDTLLQQLDQANPRGASRFDSDDGSNGSNGSSASSYASYSTDFSEDSWDSTSTSTDDGRGSGRDDASQSQDAQGVILPFWNAAATRPGEDDDTRPAGLAEHEAVDTQDDTAGLAPQTRGHSDGIATDALEDAIPVALRHSSSAHSEDGADDATAVALPPAGQDGAIVVTLPDADADVYAAIRADSVREMLEYYAELGDVQTCVCIARVLGRFRKEVADQKRLQLWVWAYIDLLHRLQLWSPAAQIIAKCENDSVRRLNQADTSLTIGCCKCSKQVGVNSSLRCLVCKKSVSGCSLCEQPVRGLYAWCQGCAHGGHLHHMKEWFTKNNLCPAGCGHACDLRSQFK